MKGRTLFYCVAIFVLFTLISGSISTAHASVLDISQVVDTQARNIGLDKHIIDDSFAEVHDVYATDVDRDGDMDVVGAAFTDDDIAWWKNDGNEAFTKHVIDGNFDGAHGIYAADIDGDGDVDLLGAAWLADDIAWWENDGSENFTKHILDGNFDSAVSVYATDIDGDGDADVLGAAREASTIAWWENLGNGNFGKHIVDNSFDWAHWAYAVDMDGDGDTDIVGAARRANQIAWWENDGNENFAKHVIDGSFRGPRRVYAIDVDGDGDVDVLGAAMEDNSIAWWENDGGEQFTRHTVVSNFASANSVHAADLDNDGDVDILGTAGSAGDIAWWENDGNENLTMRTIDDDFCGAVGLYAADLDSDGDMDILGGGACNNEVAWWEQESGNTPPTISVNWESTIANEGQVAVNGGMVSDPDGDPVTVQASVGSVISHGNGGWSWSLMVDDGPAQSQTVVVSADDGKGGTSWGTFELIVNNVPPTVLTQQDTPFGTNGLVTTTIGSGADYGHALVLQPDGKIVVAGYSYNGANNDFALVRYHSDGTLDTSFDGDGKVTTDFAAHNDQANGLALQPDGKIVAVGVSKTDSSTYGVWAIARYNSDGSLDTTFDGDGRVTTNMAASVDSAYSVAIQGDGKIVVWGERDDMSPPDFVLARYNSDGSLDTSFDGDGIAITIVGSPTDQAKGGMLIQSDGKIVAAGCSEASFDQYDFAALRYNSDGSLDTSFSGDGIAMTNLGTRFDWAYAMTLQSDGKIILGGNVSNDYQAYDLALVRYNSDGSLDTTFGSGGRVIQDVVSGNVYEGIHGLAVQDDGKVLALGNTNGNFLVLRYNSDGSLDTTFGSGGYTLTDFGGDDWGNDIVIQQSGKIVVVGTANSGADADIALARYNSNGSLDTGTGPIPPTPFPTITVQVGAPASASASFVDPGVLDTHTAEWNWGDGILSSGVVVETAGAGSVTGSYAYTAPGFYTVTLTVTDKDGATAESVVQYVIVNAPPAVSVYQESIIVDEGQLAANVGMASDPDGDPVALQVSAGLVVDNGDGTWSWSLMAEDGPVQSQTVVILADDGDGGTSQATFELIVNNAAPVVSAITATVFPIQVGTSVNASASFVDPGLLDTHTAEWSWGDGQSLPGTVTEAAGSGSVSDNHTYTVPGVYTIRLAVTDKDGAVTESFFQYVVVYDPAGGFVTGGGWIDSPPGAYTPDPSLAGKANFGFVSKYKKGATVPTGQTEFQFKVAGLNFHSDTYDWLVVAGARAQFKGTGTINGMGTYGFILTAIDGDGTPGKLDRFRIKIWDKATGMIVYDNQMGDADDVEATTVLGGGNITIHK